MCGGDDPLVYREVLKKKMEAPQSVDGVPLTVLPSEEMAEHQLVGGILVGSEALGILEHKEREREREGERKREREREGEREREREMHVLTM